MTINYVLLNKLIQLSIDIIFTLLNYIRFFFAFDISSISHFIFINEAVFINYDTYVLLVNVYAYSIINDAINCILTSAQSVNQLSLYSCIVYKSIGISMYIDGQRDAQRVHKTKPKQCSQHDDRRHSPWIC